MTRATQRLVVLTASAREGGTGGPLNVREARARLQRPSSSRNRRALRTALPSPSLLKYA